MRMPLRAAMPSTVKNPTSAPSVIVPSAPQAASTPPTSAIGSVSMSSHASRQLRNATCSSSRSTTSVARPSHSSRAAACCRSAASPCSDSE